MINSFLGNIYVFGGWRKSPGNTNTNCNNNTVHICIKAQSISAEPLASSTLHQHKEAHVDNMDQPLDASIQGEGSPPTPRIRRRRIPSP